MEHHDPRTPAVACALCDHCTPQRDTHQTRAGVGRETADPHALRRPEQVIEDARYGRIPAANIQSVMHFVSLCTSTHTHFTTEVTMATVMKLDWPGIGPEQYEQ